jgi:hypothetical protein
MAGLDPAIHAMTEQRIAALVALALSMPSSVEPQWHGSPRQARR